MEKNLNYKRIFKNVINHSNGKNFMLDFGGDQASVSIFTFGEVLKRIGVNRQPTVNSLVQLSSAPEIEFLKKYNIGIRWLYPKPSKKSIKLGERFRDVVKIDVEDELERGYISRGRGKYFIDEWGVKWKRSAYYFEMVDHPLKGKSFNDIKKYSFPDPKDKSRIDGLDKDLNNYLDENPDYVISLSQSYGGLFETALWLRGFSDFYIDIASNTKECNYLLDRLKEYFTEWNRNYLDAVDGKIDILAIGDDYGMQNGMLIDPDTWRKQIKTRYREIINAAKSRYSNLKWFHHSCGSIYQIINDLIEIGVDILNPIQPTAKDMEPEKLKKAFGNRLTFHGGIDIQKMLLFSDPGEIREKVKRIIDILANDGGFIVAPSHNIQASTPVDNIMAFYETANDCFLEIINN